MALQIGIGNFGGAVASNVYRSQDGPRYLVGREFLRFVFCFFDCFVLLTVILARHRWNHAHVRGYRPDHCPNRRLHISYNEQTTCCDVTPV